MQYHGPRPYFGASTNRNALQYFSSGADVRPFAKRYITAQVAGRHHRYVRLKVNIVANGNGQVDENKIIQHDVRGAYYPSRNQAALPDMISPATAIHGRMNQRRETKTLPLQSFKKLFSNSPIGNAEHKTFNIGVQGILKPSHHQSIRQPGIFGKAVIIEAFEIPQGLHRIDLLKQQGCFAAEASCTINGN